MLRPPHPALDDTVRLIHAWTALPGPEVGRKLSAVKPRPSRPTSEEPATQSYEADFYAWTQESAALLRAGRFAEADIAHVAEEIEDMGRRDLRELDSRVQVLLAHLLEWQLQPERRTPSWRATITTQRLELDALLAQSPSLRPRLVSGIAENHRRAIRRAAAEVNLAPERFPPICPYSLEQVLDDDFLP